MPGNGAGEKVHNFFAQDNLSQSQHHAPVSFGNWPVISDNSGSQRQFVRLNSNASNYNMQHSGPGGGYNSNHVNPLHQLNSPESAASLQFSKRHSQIHPDYSGYMYENRNYRASQDETNFLAMTTDNDHQNLTSRGFPNYDSLPGNGTKHQTKTSGRIDSSQAPSLDLFGSEQQMSHQQSSMLQSLQRQQSGISDIRQLQHEIMFMKMHELQRQQQLPQLDARHQQSQYQISSFPKQASGGQFPTFANGSSDADASNFALSNELGNTNWQVHGSPLMQGSSNGLFFPTMHGQTQLKTCSTPTQFDQSLYGVPISDPRGDVNLYPPALTDKGLLQQMVNSNNSIPSNPYTLVPDLVNSRNENFVSGQRFEGDTSIRHSSDQTQSNLINLMDTQQVNTMNKTSLTQEFRGRHDTDVASEALQERIATPVASSKEEVGLDPTEEKILFGSDDNIWSAFGESPNMSGEACNSFDGAGLLNSFSTVNSGTWSALMQSAVAETSSTTGLQEKFCASNFRSNEVPPDKRNPSAYKDGGRQQASSSSETLNKAPFLSQLPQFNQNFPQSFQSVQATSQKSVQLSGEGKKWSNLGKFGKSVAEGRSQNENASHVIAAEANRKSGSSTWMSMVPRGNASSGIQESENSSQTSLGIYERRIIHGDVEHGSPPWNPASTTDLEPLNSSVANLQVNNRSPLMNNPAAMLNSSAMRVSEEATEIRANGDHVNYLRNVNSSAEPKQREGMGRSQHLGNNQVLNSSLNVDQVKMHVMGNNGDKKENPNDRFHYNVAHHTSASDTRENVSSDQRDSQSLPSGKEKSSYQGGRKTSGSRKFQYHPMGNLDKDVGPSFGLKNPTDSQSTFQKNAHFSQLELIVQDNNCFSDPRKGQSPDLERNSKGVDDVSEERRYSGHKPDPPIPFSRATHTDAAKEATQSGSHMLQLLQKVDQSTEYGRPAHLISADQTALSKLTEADNSRLSVARLNRSHSNVSQGFGLQLGPPSQQLPIQNCSQPSHTSAQVGSSSSNAAIDVEEKALAEPVSVSSVQSLFHNERLRGNFVDNRSGFLVNPVKENSHYKMSENVSSAYNFGPPFPRNQLTNQQAGSSGEHINFFLDRHGLHSSHNDLSEVPPNGQSAEISLNKPHGGVPVSQISTPTSVPLTRPVPVTALNNMFRSVPDQQNLLIPQIQKEPFHLPPSLVHSNNVETASSVPQNQGDSDVKKPGSSSLDLHGSPMNLQSDIHREEQPRKESSQQQLSSGNVNTVGNMNESQGKEPVMRNPTAESPVFSAFPQRDIETFGQSLKPNSLSHQNYSLLNQMWAMKTAETDPINRVSKRIRGADGSLGCQQVAVKAVEEDKTNRVIGDALDSQGMVASGDSRLSSFSGTSDNEERNAPCQQGNVSSRDMVAFTQDVSQSNSCNNNTTTFKNAHSHISPQMAPSWFSQYGTFKNGQMLHMNDGLKVGTMQAAEPFTLGRSSSDLQSFHTVQQMSASSISSRQVGCLPAATVDHLPSSQILLDVGGKHVISSQTKKRKSATSELGPWHTEVSCGSGNLLTASMAEASWAKSSNRLCEKIDEPTDWTETGSRLKPRRRLVLTTQLMQRLFGPPPAAFLSTNADSGYECVAYFVSRLALGDACSIICGSGGDSDKTCDSKKIIPDKLDESDKNSHLLSKVTEFIGRAKKLENDFIQLEKRASISDLTVDCQELERFSVINRFAVFHGRGQADSSVTSSSSDAASNSQRPYPQRYVNALPMPRNPPDRVQCLSL